MFTREILTLLDEEVYRLFQSALAANPAMGSLIRGGGRIRKVRVAMDGIEGKSGGAHVIYDWAVRKNVAENLTQKQTAQLAKAVKEEFSDEIKDV